MDNQLGLLSVQEDMENLKKSGVALNSFIQQGDYAKGRPHAEACITIAKKLKLFLQDPNRPKDLDPKVEEILRWIQPLLVRVQQLEQQQDPNRQRSPPRQRSPTLSRQLPQGQQSQPQQQQQQQPSGKVPILIAPGANVTNSPPVKYSPRVLASPRTSETPSPTPVHREKSKSPGPTRDRSPFSKLRAGGGGGSSFSVGSTTPRSEANTSLAASAPLGGKLLFPNADSFAVAAGSSTPRIDLEEEDDVVDTTMELTIYQARFPHVSHLPDWLELQPGDMVTRVFSPDMDPIPGWEIGVSHRTGSVGLFPVAYADIVDTGFQHSAVAAKSGLRASQNFEENGKEEEGVEVSEETMKKAKKLNKQSSLYGPNRINAKGTSEEKEKRKMGIAADKRASMALQKPIVFKESFHTWDKPEYKMTTVTKLKKGASSKEKKKVKEEIERIIGDLNANAPNLTKVDLSGAGSISYSLLKKIYASLKGNKRLVYLNLSGVGVTGSHIQILEVSMQINRTLRALDLSGNGFGVKELKLLESMVQKNYGLMEIKLFSSPDEKKKELESYVKNIEWYLNSNVEFVRFVKGEHKELRLCGRAIVSTLGWEAYPETTLLNASYNYLKEFNAKIGNTMLNLVDINISHNDISTLPYSFGQLQKLKNCDCSHNQIKEIPSSMDRCTSLTNLNVSFNKIRIFPHGVLSLPQLATVHAENNKCKLPPGLKPEEAKKFLLEKYAK
uniref:SH3 domain-containing protein n=1 Tax=Paramoeba aestuarina TaxID=180227 RepID=A0A6U3BDE2_9EUKA